MRPSKPEVDLRLGLFFFFYVCVGERASVCLRETNDTFVNKLKSYDFNITHTFYT